MIAAGKRKAEPLAIGNIRWITQRAQQLGVDPDSFDLVAIGNAFHRLNRADVASKTFGWLKAGGHLALLWSDTPWTGEAEWQIVASRVMNEWCDRLGVDDQVPSNLGQVPERHPHEAVLAQAGSEVVGRFEFPTLLTWTAESLAGFAFSTSGLARPVVGDLADEFRGDLRERLRAVEPSDTFRQRNVFAYQLARRPQ